MTHWHFLCLAFLQCISAEQCPTTLGTLTVQSFFGPVWLLEREEDTEPSAEEQSGEKV